MNYFFYDIVPTNIVRFFEDYIREIREVDPEARFYFALEHEDNMTFQQVEKHYDFAMEFIYIQFKSSQWIERYLRDKKIDIVFINGQRIADDRVIYSAKKLSIKSYMIQHGMYISFMKRDSKFFLSKIRKTISFLFYALNLSFMRDVSSLLFFKYIRCYVFGSNQVSLGIQRDIFNVDKVFVYGKYWVDFHRKQFGYRNSQCCVMGTPDLSDLSDLDKNCNNNLKNDDAICYIAQTLVEDGRLAKDLQVNFFNRLLKFCIHNKLKLFVKLHPRGDISLYKDSPLFHDVDVTFFENTFPYTPYYIGHYSSLLAKSMSIDNTKTYIFEFEGHPTPDYFIDAAHRVLPSNSDWSDKLSLVENSNTKDIQEVFEYNPDYVSYVINEINISN